MMRSALGFFLLAGALFACGRAEREVRIATLTDLTGPQAPFGEGIRRAADLAVGEWRTALQSAGWQVRLAAYDAFGTPAALTDTIRRMAGDLEIACAVVHTDTDGNEQAMRIFHTAGLANILPAETDDFTLDVLPPETAALPSADLRHGAAAAIWSAARGDRKILLLSDSGTHARSIAEGLLARADDLGLTVYTLAITEGESISQKISSFLAVQPDSIFFSGSPQISLSVLQYLESAEYADPFFFIESEAEDQLPDEFSSETVPLFFSPATPDSEPFARAPSFSEKYQSAYDEKPPPLAALGYDAASFCLASLLAAGRNEPEPVPSRSRVVSYLRSEELFQGMTGSYRFSGGRSCRTSIYRFQPSPSASWIALPESASESEC
jgi:ABC-type branched-subunit amino acid transport system substrate-binding protein